MKIQAQAILTFTITLENVDFIRSICFEHGINLYRGDSLPSRNSVHSAEECQKMCSESNFCYYFTWIKNMNVCFLKGMQGWVKQNSSGELFSISGPKQCSSADYLMGWRLMTNTHCGGKEILDLPEKPNKYWYLDYTGKWGYTNTRKTKDIDIFHCESECRLSDECECFMFNESNTSCHFYYRDTLTLNKTEDTYSHTSYVKPSYWDDSICSNGDVSLKDDGTPLIFWDGQWSPICGHYF